MLFAIFMTKNTWDNRLEKQIWLMSLKYSGYCQIVKKKRRVFLIEQHQWKHVAPQLNINTLIISTSSNGPTLLRLQSLVHSVTRYTLEIYKLLQFDKQAKILYSEQTNPTDLNQGMQ